MLAECPFCHNSHQIRHIKDRVECTCGAYTSRDLTDFTEDAFRFLVAGKASFHWRSYLGSVPNIEKMRKSIEWRMGNIINPLCHTDPIMMHWSRWKKSINPTMTF